MKTLKNKIKELVQNKLINTKATEQDYESFSKVFDFFLQNEVEKSQEEEEIVKHLHSILLKKREYREKLDEIKKINYFGEYLFSFLRYNNLTYTDVCQKIEIDESLLHRLIENKIKIFDISPFTLAKLVKYLNLKLEIARELIVKTILINYGNATVKNSLARYSKDKGLDEKGKSMSSAVNELLLKAHNSKPISYINHDVNKKTDAYITKLEKALNEL